MRISEVMTPNPACCPRDMKLPEVARFMRNNDCGEIPVLDDDRSRKLVGVVTDRDITCRAVAEGLDITQTTAGDIMTTPVVSVDRDADIDECRNRMEAHQVRRIPVVDAAGGVCGIVSQADIARIATPEETAELVQDISRPRRAQH
ncbi:MAG: CBS domain-containing protein [Proteobacteria bacterium]|nr:CBS domain-containing protein [Pseudomonadota bacterium]